MKLEQLDKGQIAYRDMDGNLTVLPMQDETVRERFITWLIHDHVEERSIEELKQDLRQAGEDIAEEYTKTIGELKEEADNQ